MIKRAFKRLWNDKRGNALVIAGAAMPLLFGSVGLATDTVQWTLWKRQLQRSADSAAFAGAYARFQETGPSVGAAVDADLDNNEHLAMDLLAGYPQVSQPADTATFTRAVEVKLAIQQPLTFSSMFMSAAPIITATARAAAIDTGNFCVVALENTTASGIIIQGSTNVNLGCGMISNSPSSSVSVGVNGNAHTVTAEPVAGAGGVPDINGVTGEQSYHLAQPDPYEGKYSTDIPAGVSCGNMASHVVSNTGGVTTLSPGCYSGNNNQFKFNGGTTHLQPGTYYLDNIDFIATGGTITGSGVTIVLTGTSPGQISMNGNAVLQLSAPSADPDDPYYKLLMIQSTNATNSTTPNTINGGATSMFDGTVYFPKQEVKFSGSSAATTKCAMVVARRVSFEGNSNIQNDTTGCTASSKVKGKAIKLIA